MKKLISLILVLCMACAMGAAFAEEDVTGDWYADYYGMVMKMTVNADGTVSLYAGENLSSTATWTLEGNQFRMKEDESGTEYEGTLNGTELVLKQGEVELVFGREPVEGTKLADEDPNAKPEDFEGVWKVRYMTMSGMVIDAETAAASTGEQMPTLTIKDGEFSFANEDGSENSMMSMYAGSAPMKLEYADGAMSTAIELGEMKMGFKVVMLQDGMLGFNIYMGEEAIVGFYFYKAE